MEPKKFNSLVVTETQKGHFYKAKFNGLAITEKELFERILKVEKGGFRISHYVDAFAKTNRGNFNVLMQEQDVS